MKKKHSFYNAIIDGAVDIALTWIKENIRMDFSDMRKRKSCNELLDECKDRVLKLEIKAQKEVPNSKPSLDWETDQDAIERAKHLPPRGYVLPGIIREGSLCNIQSIEKGGKSVLAKQIAHDYAHGKNSMCLPNADQAQQNESFIYDAEMDDEDVLERYGSLNDQKVHRCRDAHFETSDAFMKHLRASISNVNSNALVVVDNVSTICYNFSKADVDKVRSKCVKLQTDFCARGFRLTLIFIHHTKNGSSGSKTDDRSGSVQWGRVGCLNLSLLPCNLGPDYRVLKVINRRGADELLASEEVAVLRIEAQPFLHFKYERNAREEEVLKKNPSKQSSNASPSISRKLTEKEKEIIRKNYSPGKIGLGSLARLILQERRIEVDEKGHNQMKDVIKRFLTSEGLYQGQNR